eukprot:scaffold46218_cov139-Skeletonema_marinoi.AAC.1
MVEDCNGSFTPTAVRLQTVAAHFQMNFDYLVQETDELNEGDKSLVKPAILNVGEFDTRGITEKILASNSDDVELEDFLNYWIFSTSQSTCPTTIQSIVCNKGYVSLAENDTGILSRNYKADIHFASTCHYQGSMETGNTATEP